MLKEFLMIFLLVALLGAGCVRQFDADVTNADIDAPSGNDGVGNKNDVILVTIPHPNAKVSSPLRVTGFARGFWYFEASFPVKVYDANHQLVGSGHAQAQGEWMTEDFVPFKAEVNFTATTKTGSLVLEKDNHSDLPEHDDSITVPITF